MRLTREGRLVRTDAWREGKYLDLWSVPHFLSGVATALGLYLLDFSVSASFVIAFLLFLAYEMFEALAKIKETRWNRILDVVVGMASFTPAFLLVPAFSWRETLLAFVIVTIVDAILSFFGWLASRKAAILEVNVRNEFAKERERFAVRRAAFAKDWRNRRDRWRAPGF